jgi:hypothetical protein
MAVAQWAASAKLKPFIVFAQCYGLALSVGSRY